MGRQFLQSKAHGFTIAFFPEFLGTAHLSLYFFCFWGGGFAFKFAGVEICLSKNTVFWFCFHY